MSRRTAAKSSFSYVLFLNEIRGYHDDLLAAVPGAPSWDELCEKYGIPRNMRLTQNASKVDPDFLAEQMKNLVKRRLDPSAVKPTATVDGNADEGVRLQLLKNRSSGIRMVRRVVNRSSVPNSQSLPRIDSSSDAADELAVVSSRGIPEGEEVTISHLNEREVPSGRKHPQEILEDTCGINCRCSRCVAEGGQPEKEKGVGEEVVDLNDEGFGS